MLAAACAHVVCTCVADDQALTCGCVSHCFTGDCVQDEAKEALPPQERSPPGTYKVHGDQGWQPVMQQQQQRGDGSLG